jgi:VanZ family protein
MNTQQQLPPGLSFRAELPVAPAPATIKPVLQAAHYGWLTLAVLLLIGYGSLVPFQLRPQSFAEAWGKLQNITFSPVTDLGGRGDWSISVVLFAVISFLAMGMLCVDRPRSEAWRSAPFVMLACAALAVAIEFCQIFFPPRTVSVNDLIVQSTGGCLGVLVWLLGGARVTRWVRRLGSATGVAGLARRLWPGYLAVLLATQLMPFDFTVSASELAIKYDEGKIWLTPFALSATRGLGEFLAKVFIHTLCFAPLGFLWVLAGDGRARQPFHWLSIAAWSALLAALVEAAQLFVYTRFFDSTDVLLGAAAVCLGWYVGQAFCARWQDALANPEMPFGPQCPGVVWAGAIVVWLAAVLYFNWTPFNFTAEPAAYAEDFESFPRHGMRRFAWLPIVDYYWGSKYNALDQFLKKMLSFAPLGVIVTLAARRLYQPKMGWAVVGLAFVVGTVIEVGSYFLPQRYPSTTDVVIACIGAWLGFALTQHVWAVFWAERMLFGYVRRFA